MAKKLKKLLMPLAILAANLVSLLIQALIPQYLPPEEYSRFTLLWSYGQLFVVVFFEWMRSSVLRFAEGADAALAQDRRKFLMSAYVATATAILVVALVAYLLGDIWPIAIWISVALFYSVCQGLFDGTQVLARARFENVRFATSWMTRSVLALLGSIGAAYLTGSGSLAVVGMALSFTMTVLVFNFRYLRSVSVSGLNDRESFRFLFAYGAFLAVTSALTALFPALTRTAGVSILGSEDAGGMLFALDITQRTISALGMAINLVVLQRSIRAAEFEDKDGKQWKIREQVALVAGFIFPAGVGFFSIQDSLSILMVPESYRETYFQCIAGACLCACLISFRSYGIDTMFVVAGKSRRAVVGPVVSLVSALAFIYAWGELFSYSASQIIYSMIIGLSLGAVATVLSVRSQLQMNWPFRDIAIVLVACVLMYLAIDQVEMSPGLYKLAIDVLVGGATYLVAIFLLNFINLRKRLLRF